MNQKINNKSPVKNTQTAVAGFITYNPQTGFDQAQIAKTINAYTGFASDRNTAVASSFQQFKDIVTNISVRDDYRRSDYEYFRPGEKIPVEIHEIISVCMEAYRRVGIVRNIIDLMSDFSVKGIVLNHPNPQKQRFFRGWFQKVNGPERSERFLNLLYRSGNTPVKRTLGKIDIKYVDYLKSLAEEGDLPIDKVSLLENQSAMVIPIRYDFLNPVNIYVIGGEIAHFIGKTLYSLKVPIGTANRILSPRTEEEKILVSNIPQDIYQKLRAGQRQLPLNPDNFKIYFWKKDDWQDLGEPLIFCIFDALLLLQKMQLADLAALDGAISQIRLWKLGNIEKNMWPTDAAISKLNDILMSNPGGGAFDLIWGPDLEVEELKTSVHQFLGKAKYEPVLESIYSGLGVPPTLTGTANAAGFTNNFISLKTLTERLDYGRKVLTAFWDEEIRFVQKAMGFRFPATVDFDRTVLSDEAAEKALYIQLIDRNYISEETFLHRFGECDELEMLRKRREEKERETGQRMARGGPWSTLERDFTLLKLFVQKGMITPKGAGLEDITDKDFIDPRKQIKTKNTDSSDPSRGTGGRPFNSNDKDQRDRNYKIRTSAEEHDWMNVALKMTWAKEALGEIHNILLKPYLENCGKTDIRSLNKEQQAIFEDFKYNVLCGCVPFNEITEIYVGNFICGDQHIDPRFVILYNKLCERSRKNRGVDLTLDEQRLIRTIAYSVLVD